RTKFCSKQASLRLETFYYAVFPLFTVMEDAPHSVEAMRLSSSREQPVSVSLTGGAMPERRRHVMTELDSPLISEQRPWHSTNAPDDSSFDELPRPRSTLSGDRVSEMVRCYHISLARLFLFSYN